MKHIQSILILLVLLINTNGYSQENRQDKLESYKIAFITQELDLTSKEAQQFWPVYNNHQKEMKILRVQSHKLRSNIKNNEGFESISNDKAEKYLDQFIEIETQIQSEKISLFTKLKPILPAKKILKLYRAEQDFNRKILERLKNRSENFRARRRN